MPLLWIAGLILLLAGKSWFAGAATVGWICLIVGLAPVAVFLVIALLGLFGVGIGAAFSKKKHRRLRGF